MAVKDSDQIETDSNYTLGDYSFRIERSSVPGSSNDKIEAICTDKDGKNARKSIQVPSSTQMLGWYVEANETEASVYAIERIPTGDSDEHTYPDFGQGPWPQPVNAAYGEIRAETSQYRPFIMRYNGYLACLLDQNDMYRIDSFMCSESPGVGYVDPGTGTWPWNVNVNTPYTYDGKTVYYGSASGGLILRSLSGGVNYRVGASGGGLDIAKAAWTVLYGIPVTPTEYETKQVIVGRFAIDVEDAGGVGPGSGWIDPGDYDPDWEEGDPTHTLYVTVTGALSGRHNDPIEDPSYSYIPADKDTVKDYGCGGDGGHGGGGGAGASTVVVHKFATNQANSKEVTAIARRHGYGSGGGKGGKGGDGCILVYY